MDWWRWRGGASAWQVASALVLGLLVVAPLVAWQDAGVEMKGVSEYTFETGPDGTYSVTGVPEGEYSIEVLKPGYARLMVGARRMDPAKTARADFYLNLGNIRETVPVDGGQGVPVIRVSGNVQAAKLLKKVNPAYPPEAKQARMQGTVRMRAVISKEGEVLGLTLLMSPSAELARSAMEAVNQWKWSPTLLNGQPVEIQTEIDVNYSLTK